MESSRDGTLGNSEEVAGFSGEVALVKRLTLWCGMFKLSTIRLQE